MATEIPTTATEIPQGQQRLRSQLCTEVQFCSPTYRAWCEKIIEPQILHRKVWEYYYICQGLYEREMLTPGRRGLGFAVGQEPLPATFASFGCEIVGSDLDPDDERAQDWRETGQHASNLAALNRKQLCDPESFSRLVSFRAVDMNAIPEDLTGFDFTWSSCALEHLGSLEAGLAFFENSMRCLRPGGVAIHTTEFNLDSNEETIASGGTVVYRRRDIEELVNRLQAVGCEVEPLDFDPGSGPADRVIDEAPFTGDICIRLRLEQFACTSIGIIARKAAP